MIQMKELQSFKDQYGFICHLDDNYALEAGDCSQRTFTELICLYHEMKSTYDRETLAREVQKKVEMLLRFDDKHRLELVRHWDRKKWPGQEGTMSRDQMCPLIICLVLYSKYCLEVELLRKAIFQAILKRGGFLWNTKHIGQTSGKKIPDWIGPWLFMAFFRRNVFLYPVFMLLDGILFFSTLVRCLFGLLDRNDVGDDLNLQNNFFLTYLLSPNPVAKFSRLTYAALRPVPSDLTGKRLKSYYPPWGIWFAYYWDKEKHPPMYLVARALVWEAF